MESQNSITIQNAVSKKRRRKRSSITVTNEELLYQIADAGLLSKLHGVQAKTEPRTYYFDIDPDIKEVVDKFVPYNATY